MAREGGLVMKLWELALISLLAQLFVGCGPLDVAWESPEWGVAMLAAGDPTYFTPEQLDAMTGHVVRGMEELLPAAKLVRGAGSARVMVVDEPFVCDAPPDNLCMGSQFGPTLRVVARNCAWRTSYSHELIHWLLEVSTGDGDNAHSHAAWAISAETFGECDG